MFRATTRPTNSFMKPKAASLDSIKDDTAFPTLGTSCSNKPSPTDAKPVLNFKEKLETKREDVEKKVEPIVYKQGKRYATPAEIMSALNDNYERWKSEYIEEYGYDEYERNYRFQDWDYEYFDKLDEKYEAEMKKEEDKEIQREEEAEFVTEVYEEYQLDS